MGNHKVRSYRDAFSLWWQYAECVNCGYCLHWDTKKGGWKKGLNEDKSVNWYRIWESVVCDPQNISLRLYLYEV